MQNATTLKPAPKRSFKPKHSVSSVRSPLLQRKCSCGNSAGLAGECSECQQKNLTLQRRANNQAEVSEVPPIVHEVLRSPGHALEPSARTFMESRFVKDFSQIKVHADEKAQQSAKSVNALAYTVGKDIVFAASQYRPDTRSGRALLAHELAHTIQQSEHGNIRSDSYQMGHEAVYSKSSINQSNYLAKKPFQKVKPVEIIGQPILQKAILLPEVLIEGDPNFYMRAMRRNQHYAMNPPQSGWPYSDLLSQLWQAGAFDDFADAVREYQVQHMGKSLQEADGILGPQTTTAMQTRPPSSTDSSADIDEALQHSDYAATSVEPSAPVSPPLASISEDLSTAATSQPWPYHEQVYDRWQQEGRSLGIAGLASTWAGYLNQMRETTFMGHRVVGHEVFLTRLHQAQTYLYSTYPNLSNQELVTRVGHPGDRSQWRASERGTSYHVFGLAIDINAGLNPWIGNPAQQTRNDRSVWTIWRAIWLMGSNALPVWPADSHERATSQSQTTEELWQHFHQTSQVVGQYFTLLSNPQQLQARIASLGQLPTQPPNSYSPSSQPIAVLLTGDADTWQTVIEGDRDSWPTSQPTQGFMNLRLELVHALRDVAGLSWGAADLGHRESGDFMHFDLRTPQFERLRSEIRRLAQQ